MGSVDALSAVVKWVAYLSSLQAAGLMLFSIAFLHAAPGMRGWAGPRIVLSACLALFTSWGWFALEPARMSGSFEGAFDRELVGLAWDGKSTALLMRSLGLGGLLWSAVRDVRSWAVAGIAVACVVASFVLTGHTTDSGLPAQAVLALHVAIVTFWFGSLTPLWAVTQMEPAAVAGRIVESFSAIATTVVPGLLLAGVILAWLIGVRASTLDLPYGRLLVGKVVGFAALMAIAGINKWRLGPRLRTGDSRALAQFRASVAIEYVAIASLLALTATLTTFYSIEA